MYLEAQHEDDPDLVWLVKVTENVGGRLLLRYVTADNGDESSLGDFWMFYLHQRLHPIGWARSRDCKYRPPPGKCFAYLFVECLAFLYWLKARGL